MLLPSLWIGKSIGRWLWRILCRLNPAFHFRELRLVSPGVLFGLGTKASLFLAGLLRFLALFPFGLQLCEWNETAS